MEAALGGKTQKTFFLLPVEAQGRLPDHGQALAVAKLVCNLGAVAPAKTTDVRPIIDANASSEGIPIMLFRLSCRSVSPPSIPSVRGSRWCWQLASRGPAALPLHRDRERRRGHAVLPRRDPCGQNYKIFNDF